MEMPSMLTWIVSFLVMVAQLFTFSVTPAEPVLATESEYIFSAVEGEPFGSKIRNVYTDIATENDAHCRGAMLALFGEPRYTTDDCENAYDYVIMAEKDGESIPLTVYQGPTGAAIGGDAGSANAMAADALALHIRQAQPADFEAIIYYGDTLSRITYGVKDGQAYAIEEQPFEPPWWDKEG